MKMADDYFRGIPDSSTCSQAFDAFKDTVKYIIHQCAELKGQTEFTSSKKSRHRLSRLAINVHVPCINAVPHWECTQAHRIALALLQVGAGLSKYERIPGRF